MEGRVLFRIKNFQQGGLRVTPEILTYFVNLVQYEHGV